MGLTCWKRGVRTTVGEGGLSHVGVNMVQSLVSSHREDDKLMSFGEYKVQVGVVVATHNNKGHLRQ